MIKIPSFSAYYSVCTRKVGARAKVLVESDLERNLNAELLVENENFESVGVQIKLKGETLAVISVYRPPFNLVPDFF